jgi:hypothetical protein
MLRHAGEIELLIDAQLVGSELMDAAGRVCAQGDLDY